MTHYGIKFTGPQRKNIWWRQDGPYGNRVMTFTDINDACEWAALRKSLWPHCQYVVEEIPPDLVLISQKPKRQMSWEEKFWRDNLP